MLLQIVEYVRALYNHAKFTMTLKKVVFRECLHETRSEISFRHQKNTVNYNYFSFRVKGNEISFLGVGWC